MATPSPVSGSFAMDGSSMMGMMKAKMMMDLIGGASSNAGDNLWTMALKFLAIMLIDDLSKLLLHLFPTIKGWICSHIRWGKVKDPARKFTYELQVDNNYYVNLVSSQALGSDSTFFAVDTQTDPFGPFHTLSMPRTGVKKFLAYKDGNTIATIKKIGFNNYIYYRREISAGKIIRTIACDVSMKCLYDYLDELDVKFKALHRSTKLLDIVTKQNGVFEVKQISTCIEMRNVYVESKEAMLEIYNRFTDKEWYKSRNLPHHLSVLLKGDPGCGKTSFIKASAFHLGRSILFLDCVKDLKTKSDLKVVFDIYSPTHIIVLEDFDRIPSVLVKNTVTSTTTAAETTSEEQKNKENLSRLLDAYVKAEEGKKGELLKLYNDELAKQTNDDSLDLAFILNTLDGIQEYPNRMVIFTANHPERIEPALLRPGRIDYVVDFKRTTRAIIQQILCFFFSLSAQDLRIRLSPATSKSKGMTKPLIDEVTDYKFTHAQIYGLCKKYNDPVKVVRELLKPTIDLSSIVI